ncbi:MAG: hypothetical protein JWM36_263 [Hyphomicrobiales bacterium]|nr:hypothetical protein [Hyphomicrobiales bacterium]
MTAASARQKALAGDLANQNGRIQTRRHREEIRGLSWKFGMR